MNSFGFLRVENLRKEFRKSGGVLEVLKGISFTLDRGESLAVVGVSGAGKTTLLQIVGTLDRATSGRILYDGQDVTTDRKSTRLNSSHMSESRMPSSA